jgi:hypothetical protein
MKKSIGTYYSHYFKMPHLYRDDLNAIEKAILHDLKPSRYRLAFGGVEYEHLDEIPQDTLSTNVLVIYTIGPSLRLKFSRSWTELYSGEDSTDTDETIRTIAHIVSRGERFWLWNFCQSSMWLAPLVGFGSFGLVTAWISMGYLSVRSLYLVTLLLIMMSIWWAVGYHYKLHAFSCVDLQDTRSKSSWIVRHQNALMFLSMGIVFGGALTILLISYLKNH